MKRIALAFSLSAILFAAACGTQSAGGERLGQHCADLLARAISSPMVAVPGAFKCQSPSLQNSAAQVGVSDDATIQAFAKGLGYTHESPVGASEDGAFVYELTGPSKIPTIMVIWTDSKGLATSLNINDKP